jgi:hypothetical protein
VDENGLNTKLIVCPKCSCKVLLPKRGTLCQKQVLEFYSCFSSFISSLLR